MIARPHLRRRSLLAAVAIALCTAPVAAAHRPHRDGRAVIAPAKDAWLGEFWAQLYALPVSGETGAVCLTVGHKVLQEIGGPCTVEQGTTFTLGFGTAWSTAEAPFPQTRAEQLAEARAADLENVAGFGVSVDGGEPVELRTPRFELFSPQRTVQLPEDNILDVPAQTVTLSAHAWGAGIRRLSLGRHTVVGDVLFSDGGRSVVPHILDVVPKHDGGG